MVGAEMARHQLTTIAYRPYSVRPRLRVKIIWLNRPIAALAIVSTKTLALLKVRCRSDWEPFRPSRSRMAPRRPGFTIGLRRLARRSCAFEAQHWPSRQRGAVRLTVLN